MPFTVHLLQIYASLLAATLLACQPAFAAPGAGPSQPNIKADVLYHNYCSVCHGDRGDGKSRARSSLIPPPKDFTQPPLMPREAMIEIVRNGKPGTAMVGWKTQLSEAEIAGVVDYVRNTFGRSATDPRLARGRSIYGHNCAVCHGDRGQGGVPHGSGQPARSFISQSSRLELTRERMIDAVMHGRKDTAMAAFSNRLSVQDIEAVVDYVRDVLMQSSPELVSGTRAHTGRKEVQTQVPATASANGRADMSQPLPRGLQGRYARGERFYMANCATCHGVHGDGQGPRAYFINPKPKNFLDNASRAVLNRPILFATIAMGKLGTEMPAWSKVLTDQEIADVAEFVFRRYIQPAQKETARKEN